ncbi:hypothetical protein D1505_01170 [Escherichia coli]|nr:hypothetical protein CHQ87_0022265 [Escherichia coli]RIJ71640.1 hypothetical protein D1505_01170 [Escherichia coli]RIX58800.1 hypothetical protein D3I61_24600 [Escherichia coli]
MPWSAAEKTENDLPMNRLCHTSKGVQAERNPFALMAKPSDQDAGDDAMPIEICRSESSEFA